MNLPMRDHISQLTVAELLDHTRGNLQIPRANSKRKELLLDYIFANGSPDLFAQLSDAVVNKQTLQVQKREENLAARKRKRNENQNMRRTAARLEEIAEEDRDTAKFLELPTEERVKECYRQFYKGTSNAAVEMSVCAVCAREASIQSDQVTVQRLADLPNSYRLIPRTAHTAHDLFEGRLLEPSGVSGGDVKVCSNCLKELHSESDKPPAFSLANNLWIGRIPWELQVLTFPEQLLIALLYPRVYVFKLFPKDVHYRPEDSMLQRGMRGTVSTYDLNMDGAVSMVQGDLMPRPTVILPSVISVTFIGRGDLPKHWLRTTFCVRRQVIFEALRWLKTHNTKYYGHITIDLDCIRQLPEDDVPPEILGVIRQTTDTGLVDQESAGYVPMDNDERAGKR